MNLGSITGCRSSYVVLGGAPIADQSDDHKLRGGMGFRADEFSDGNLLLDPSPPGPLPGAAPGIHLWRLPSAPASANLVKNLVPHPKTVDKTASTLPFLLPLLFY